VIKFSVPDGTYTNKGNLEITTKIGCSNMCEYCPQLLLIEEYNKDKQKKIKSDQMMTVENYKKYISTIPEVIDFHFTGYVEPFDNPHCDELLLLAHEKGHKVQINTTLEGITKEKFDKIKSMPYKQFLIHLPSATYEERIGIVSSTKHISSGQPELRKDWLELLEYVVLSKPINFKVHAHGGIHPQALEVLEKLQLPKENYNSTQIRTSTRSQNKAQNNMRIKRQKVPPQFNIRGKCSRIYQPVLIPDGRLGLCCQDYGLEHVIGDLSKQTWQQYRDSLDFKLLAQHGANLCDYCDMGYHTYRDKGIQV